MGKLADRIGLLLAGLAAAALAWGFWQLAGASGFQILGVLGIVCLALKKKQKR